jgi:hypothetical protein
MTMRSPIVAILWEHWRLTRKEAAWHLALSIAAGSAVLAVFAAVATNDIARDVGARIALIVAVLPHMVGWFSINKLNITRTGFPFHLLYTRPVRTATAVGVSMSYQAAAAAALYVVSALVMRMTSPYAFPLLPAAAWIAVVTVSGLAMQWSIRNVALRTLAHLTVGVALSGLPMFLLRVDDAPGPNWAPPDQWASLFDAPLTYYVLIGVTGLASFALTVAAVTRQRRGDGRTAKSWIPGSGFPDRFVSLFRFPCWTSSTTRAQVWFELRTRGLPLLTVALALAILNPVLFAVSDRFDAALSDRAREYVSCRVDGCFYARFFAVVFAGLSVLTVVAFGGNAFGIRWRPGHRYASAFETTLAYGTGGLAGLKVLVRSICVLVAFVAVTASVWASGSIDMAGRMFVGPFANWQQAIDNAAGVLTGTHLLALAVVAAIGVAISVAAWAALGALATRYPRRVNVASSLLLLYGLAFVLRAPAGQGGNGWEVLLMDALFGATPWIAAAATALATGYLLWRAFAEQLLTLRQACGAVVVSAAFGTAWLTLLNSIGMPPAEMPATDAARLLSPAMLPLTISALATWSFSRLRHT